MFALPLGRRRFVLAEVLSGRTAGPVSNFVFKA